MNEILSICVVSQSLLGILIGNNPLIIIEKGNTTIFQDNISLNDTTSIKIIDDYHFLSKAVRFEPVKF